ncbi:hypothetical protein Neosp_011052 [[Neocosmospora] mangrovei]
MARSEMAKVAVKDAADADEDEGAHEPPQKKHLLKHTAFRRAMKMIMPSQKPLPQVIADDEEPSLQQNLSAPPAESGTAEEKGKESWPQPEGEKDITKFRFPMKGDGSLLRYLREPRRPAINWGPLMGGRHIEYKKLP